jgi:hypothetical protein
VGRSAVALCRDNLHGSRHLMDGPSEKIPNPWRWIPTLYFAQGLPYVAAMMLSVVMYKNLGVSNTDIALYTSWLYLP